MVSLGRRTWLKSVYTKPLSSSLKEAMHPLFEWYLIHKERFFWSYTDFLKKMPRSACHEIYRSRTSYGKANAPASQCGGEHAVL